MNSILCSSPIHNSVRELPLALLCGTDSSCTIRDAPSKRPFSYHIDLGHLATVNREEIPPLDKGVLPPVVSLFHERVSTDWAHAFEPFSDWIIELFGSQSKILDG